MVQDWLLKKLKGLAKRRKDNGKEVHHVLTTPVAPTVQCFLCSMLFNTHRGS